MSGSEHGRWREGFLFVLALNQKNYGMLVIQRNNLGEGEKKKKRYKKEK